MSNVRCDRCGAGIAGSGEASGLIDVRALAAMMGPRREPQAPRLSDLAVAPVTLVPASAPPLRSGPVKPAQLPLYYMLGALALGMMALATLIVSRPAPARVIEIPAVAQAPERARTAADEAEPEAPRAAAAEPAPEAEAPPEEAPKTAASEPVKGPRKGPKKPGASVPAAPAPQPAAPAPAVATGPAADSVACLIEPERCKAKPKPAPVVEALPVPSASLPEKLEPADISEGTRATKAAAQDRCKSLARGGEKVTIKLSIAGPEGAVLSASPQDDAGNPQLAACCAAELQRSTFKKVQKSQIGALATLKF